MKIAAVPDCFPRERGRCREYLNRVRGITGADRVVWLAGGCFLPDGNPAPEDPETDAARLTEAGADLVLIPPQITAADREGTETFAKIAMISRLHTIDTIAVPVSGRVSGEEIRRVAMFLFQEPREFQAEVKKAVADGMELHEARRLCTEKFVPGAGKILEDPFDDRAVELMKCMYQLYCVIDITWIPVRDMEDEMPEETAAGGDGVLYSSGKLDMAAMEALRKLASEENGGLEAFRSRVAETAGGSEAIRGHILRMAEDEAARGGADPRSTLTGLLEGIRDRAELRRFLVRLIAGIRMADNQMCGFYMYCPYSVIAGARDPDGEFITYMKEKSWIPLIRREERPEESDSGKMIFFRIDEAVRELQERGSDTI